MQRKLKLVATEIKESAKPEARGLVQDQLNPIRQNALGRAAMVNVVNAVFEIEYAERKQGDLKFEFSQAMIAFNDLRMANEKFLGFLGRCQITGHDVHILNQGLQIISHFTATQEIPVEFSAARELLLGVGSDVVGIAVYTTHFEKVQLDGTCTPIELTDSISL